jgi:hypothetical protein
MHRVVSASVDVGRTIDRGSRVTIGANTAYIRFPRVNVRAPIMSWRWGFLAVFQQSKGCLSEG